MREQEVRVAGDRMVAVAGSSGFIGAHVTADLERLGHEVRQIPSFRVTRDDVRNGMSGVLHQRQGDAVAPAVGDRHDREPQVPADLRCGRPT